MKCIKVYKMRSVDAKAHFKVEQMKVKAKVQLHQCYKVELVNVINNKCLCCEFHKVTLHMVLGITILTNESHQSLKSQFLENILCSANLFKC